jgi:hypothetical protein
VTETLETYVMTYMVQSWAGLPTVLSQVIVSIYYEHTWQSTRVHQLHLNKVQNFFTIVIVLNIGNTSQYSCNYCILNLLTIKRIDTSHTSTSIFYQF